MHALCGGDEGLNFLAQSDKQLITISVQSIFHLRSMKEGNCGDAILLYTPFCPKQLAVTATNHTDRHRLLQQRVDVRNVIYAPSEGDK
jgi:hypothetical protein